MLITGVAFRLRCEIVAVLLDFFSKMCFWSNVGGLLGCFRQNLMWWNMAFLSIKKPRDYYVAGLIPYCVSLLFRKQVCKSLFWREHATTKGGDQSLLPALVVVFLLLPLPPFLLPFCWLESEEPFCWFWPCAAGALGFHFNPMRDKKASLSPSKVET